jgi:hypothetical protein
MPAAKGKATGTCISAFPCSQQSIGCRRVENSLPAARKTGQISPCHFPDAELVGLGRSYSTDNARLWSIIGKSAAPKKLFWASPLATRSTR